MNDDLERITEVTGPDGQVYWPMSHVLELAGISRSTWTAYVARGQAPQPRYRVDSVRLWSADEVQQWHANRPGAPGRRS